MWVVADERCRPGVAADQPEHPLPRLDFVVLYPAECLESLEAYIVELPVHRPCDLTVANLEYSYLGAEHFNAGGFSHDMSLARCPSSVIQTSWPMLKPRRIQAWPSSTRIADCSSQI